MTQSAPDNESPDTPAPGHSGQDPARRIRVSYQGTDGAFSHQAAMQHFSRHCAEVELASLRRVLSHPQAIAQCSRFLAGLPDCHVETYFDTDMAARKVRDDADLTQAAIASDYAAEIYGLRILRTGLANQVENFTRFVVVGPEARGCDLHGRGRAEVGVRFPPAPRVTLEGC